MPDAPAAPIRPSERNQTLDVLRGFAMLGILLVNIGLFRGALWPSLVGEENPWTGPLDQAVVFATAWFADWKFISAFAFMFGVGTAVQLARAQARGDHSTRILRRRFAILALLGLAHGILIWPGDVLLLYALLGALLLRFRNAATRTLLRWVAGIAAVLLVLGVITALGAQTQPEGGTAATAELAPLAEQAVEVYTEGSYLDQVGFRLMEFPITQAGSLLAAPMVFMLMLLGLTAGRARMVADMARFTPLLQRVSRWGLGLGVLMNLALAAAGGTAGIGAAGDGGLQMVGASLLFLAPPVLSLGYLATLTLACRNPAVLGRLGPLAAVGRMAVSAYLFMSVVCTAFFSVTGLYGSVSPSAGLVVVAVVWALLLLICPWWLRRFRMGPVEWAWRSLTYRTRQPFRAARPEPATTDHRP